MVRDRHHRAAPASESAASAAPPASAALRAGAGEPPEDAVDPEQLVRPADPCHGEHGQRPREPEHQPDDRPGTQIGGEEGREPRRVHGGTRHDRHHARAELQTVAQAPDPSPVGGAPVFIDLPMDRGQVQPERSQIERQSQQHHERQQREPHLELEATHNEGPGPPEHRSRDETGQDRAQQVGAHREPPPGTPAPLPERSDASQHRYASGRPGGAQPGHHGQSDPHHRQRFHQVLSVFGSVMAFASRLPAGRVPRRRSRRSATTAPAPTTSRPPRSARSRPCRRRSRSTATS